MNEQLQDRYDVVKVAKHKRDKYSKTATLHQIAYFASEIGAVILLFLTPILALTGKPIWAAVSSSSGAVAGLETKYGWRRNWIQCQRTAQAIEYAIALFELKPSSDEDKEKQQVQFFQTIYAIESNHIEDWAHYVPPGESQIGKEVNDTQNQKVNEHHQDEEAINQQQKTTKQ